MSHPTFTLILSALLPVLCTFGLGFLAGQRRHFTQDHAEAINRLVILYTLPLSLFTGMMHTPKQVLMGMGPQSLILALALALSCLLPWVFMRWVLRRNLPESTVVALVVGTPSVLFIGVPVLGPLLGSASTLLIVVAGLVQNLVVLPVCLVLMSMGRHSATAPASVGHHIRRVACQPMVWAPLLAIGLVLAEVPLPAYLVDSSRLLGLATGGLALFAAGLVLQTRRVVWAPMTLWPVLARNVLIPGACYLVLRAAGASATVVQQIVLTLAIPTGSIALIVAMQFKEREREVASAVALSTVGSLFSMGGFVALTTLPG
jgi:malonate transporter